MTTHAQTEARAIQRYIAPSAGRGAVVQLLKHCDGEWVRYEDHATALAAKDEKIQALNDECQQSMLDIARERDRAERAEAQLAEANRKIAERDKALANYDRWLNGRDAYIVQKGLWQNFVASLPGSPTDRRVREAQGGE